MVNFAGFMREQESEMSPFWKKGKEVRIKAKRYTKKLEPTPVSLQNENCVLKWLYLSHIQGWSPSSPVPLFGRQGKEMNVEHFLRRGFQSCRQNVHQLLVGRELNCILFS